jgi:hypothetical protein
MRNKVSEIAERAARFLDVRYWRDWVMRELDGICPNCNLDFKPQPAEYNIAPHFMGGCR